MGNRNEGYVSQKTGPMTYRKHSKTEIVALLAQANELATQGKVQSEIADKLGISVMTLHRWRKAPVAGDDAQSAAVQSEGIDQSQRISELELENSRLRRLVTDLLLEKIDLEEELARSPNETTSSLGAFGHRHG